MCRRRIAAVLVTLCIALPLFLTMAHMPANGKAPDVRTDRIAWVARCLKTMQTVRVGMTRKDVERILTFEGGLSFPPAGHYISRECPYFKLDAEFAVRRDKDGRMVEGADDKITKVSRPYMGWAITD